MLFITDAAEIMSAETRRPSLWLLSHLQLRRVLICQMQIIKFTFTRQEHLYLVLVHLIYTHDISSCLLYPKAETMEKVTMVRVIRVLGECHIVIGSVDH